MDWFAYGADLAKSIVTAVLAGVALAFVGMKVYARQKTLDKQLEIAERAMNAFDEAEAALQLVRSPAWHLLVFLKEPLAGPRTDKFAILNEIYERSENAGDAIEPIKKIINTVWIHLGTEARDSLNVLLDVDFEIRDTAESLREMLRDDDQDAEELDMVLIPSSIPYLFRDLDETSVSKIDPLKQVDKRIKNAREQLERACEPFLRGLRRHRRFQRWKRRIGLR